MAREVPISSVLGAQCQEPKTKTKYMYLIWYSVFDNVEWISGIAGDFICNQAGPYTRHIPLQGSKAANQRDTLPPTAQATPGE